MNEPLSGIYSFVQAVEAGSFAQAAQRMHVTRSAVGKSIARLEQRLGVRLFQRTTRSQRLTADGEAYYERCVRALAELDAADAALDSGRREPSGRLRVSCPVMFGRRCVAPVLVALTNKYQRLSLDISFTDRVADLVEEGFDLAVRIGELPDSDILTTRKLGVQRMGICASPAYLAKQGTPSSLAEFTGHAAIVYGRGGGYSRTWRVREVAGGVQEIRVEPRLLLDDLQAIADAAIAGAGLAWLPCWMLAPHTRTGELALVLDSRRVLATEIHAVWPKTRYLPAKTRAAIDALAMEIPRLMGSE
jgi:DNA-binding transcriptional LysR family regulator